MLRIVREGGNDRVRCKIQEGKGGSVSDHILPMPENVNMTSC